jgi:GNAT superfamily N-acetyltransferase
MDLKSYTLAELEPYLRPLFSNPESTLPLSPLRLDSYLKNPRAEATDPVLFELRQEGELLAYRTLLPDCFFDRDGLPYRFAWLSGNWVRPDKRRQGLSTRLLEMAEEHWQGRLMYTNYAPASKALYDHTGRFWVLANREGKRFYLRSATEELLGNRLGSWRLLHRADQLINQLRKGSLEGIKTGREDSCRMDRVQNFQGDYSALVNTIQKASLFRRDSNIFNWALEYPWVTQEAGQSLPYHFSYQTSRFENILYHFSNPETGQQGIAWLLLHKRVLSVPYIFAEDKSLFPHMARSILRCMIDCDCTHTTLRSPELIQSLSHFKKVFLHTRKMPQRLFAHENLRNLLPEQPVIQDGDGDVMFTG